MKKTVSKAEAIRAALKADPAQSKTKLAKKMKVSPAYVYSIAATLKLKPEWDAVHVGTSKESIVAKLEEPKVEKPTGTDALLAERGARYGTFAEHALLTQSLKALMVGHAKKHGKEFTAAQAEALDMIAHKIGRIVNGDPNYADSWRDIEGYAKLVADDLEFGKQV